MRFGLSGEFSPALLRSISVTYLPRDRLLEFAALYFDLSTFPDGETKRALTRVQNKRLGKVDARFGGGGNGSAGGSGSEDGRKKKKMRKN